MDDDLRVHVTAQDIEHARQVWLAARDGDAPAAYVTRAFQTMVMLMHAEAEQIAHEVRARRP
jgi:hypothetical protein